LKKHGDTDKMVSKKIQDLSSDDLSYLEKLLGEKFAQELERDKTWEQKNNYSRPGEKKTKILRLINAIRAQKDIIKRTSEKW
jgi:hypothetical protein